MALTDVKVRNAKPRDKDYKLADEKGLFLLVKPSGTKYWRSKYRFVDKEKLLAFGVYPEVSLAQARQKRDEARRLLANGIDPGHHKKEKKRAQLLADESSFENIALEWHIKFSSKWTQSHGERILERLKKDVFPWIGNRPISEINAPELLSVLRRIESRGAIETAHRTHQNCGQIFRYAIATGRAEKDISGDLRGALQPVKKSHHASITDPIAIGALLRTINDYHGHFVTKCALRLAPLVFVRPGELRQAEWLEFNFDTNEWHIPAEKMKMREKHIVPLAHQAIAILKEL